jgi:RecA-family ATPase
MASITGNDEYLLKDLLPADSKIIFTGQPKKAYKSWMAYAMAMSLAAGKQIGPFIPMYPDGVPVLVLAAEGGAIKNRNRFQWLEKGLDIDAKSLEHFHFSFKEPIRLHEDAWVSKIKRLIDHLGVRLLVIDPIVMFMAGKDENSVKEVSVIMQALNELGKNGCSVLFVHHISKETAGVSKDIDQEIRGTSAFGGFYDQHWAFRRKHKSQEHNDLTIRSKDDEEKFFEIRWDIDQKAGSAAFRMDPVSEEHSKEESKAKVIAELLDGFEYTEKRLAQMSELPNDEATDLIEELVSDGVLEQKGRKYVLSTFKKAD